MHRIQTLLKNHFERHEPVRIVALGSSNTQRFAAGMHWFDCLELGVKTTYGLKNFCFNAGACGETSNDLLKRLDRDVVRFAPDVVILTVGGNDSYHPDTIPLSRFHANLLEIHKRLTACGALVVFQTYYVCDLEKMPPDHPMPSYMDEIRHAAAETDSPLQDNWTRWNHLRETDVGLYRQLMKDYMHLNALGNLLLGCEWLTALDLHVTEADEQFLAPGRFAQKTLDLLERDFSSSLGK